jgi:hypothetical protein
MNDGHVQMASHDGLIIIPERRIPSNQTHFTCHQFRPAYFGPNRNSPRELKFSDLNGECSTFCC